MVIRVKIFRFLFILNVILFFGYFKCSENLVELVFI